MRKQSLSIISAFIISAALLTGCGDTAPVPDNAAPETTEASENAASETESEDQQAVVQLDWTELGSLTTNQSLREAFETIFKTTGTTGNKEGIIYETPTSSTDTTYTYDNNNTLDVAIHNYNFRSLYDSQQSEIADAARNNFIDLEDEDDTTAIASAINSYFNLLPDTDDGNSNPNETLTRAQAMAAIMRAITPVSDDLQSDTAFESAVGTSEYNIFAQSLDDAAFLSVTNGSLDTLSYTGKMTRGEAVYLLMNKFFHDDINGASAKYPGLTFDDCIDGGEYTGTNAEILKQMLEDSSTHKVDSRIYNAMVLAQFYNILDAGESNWNAAITKAEFITLLVNTLREETTTMERFNAPDGALDVTEEELNDIIFGNENGYVKPAGTINGYENPELIPGPEEYGKSIKSMDDLPDVSSKGWDLTLHPVYHGYTVKGFMCCMDEYNGKQRVFYANMQDPTGCMFGGDKESMVLWDYIVEKGYDNDLQVTYEEAKELFGEPDMSTMVNLADGEGWNR